MKLQSFIADGHGRPIPKRLVGQRCSTRTRKSVFLLSTRAAHIMKRSGGRIANFADWLPAIGRPRYRNYVPYYASKTAAVARTEARALEFASDILAIAIALEP